MKNLLFFFGILFSTHLFASDLVVSSIDKYLKSGGYSDERITELFQGVASRKISMSEVGYRAQLAIIGYPPETADIIIERKITIKELEYRFILKELGFSKEAIEIIIQTVRILKEKNTTTLQGKVTPLVISNILEKRAKEIYPIVLEASLLHEVEKALIFAVIHQESRFVTGAISPKGASGLMQLMPGTARDLGVVDVFNPKDNIMGGTKYLKQLIDSFDGDLDLVLAAYNSGPERVARLGRIPKIAETVDYVIKVKQYYTQYEQKFAKL